MKISGQTAIITGGGSGMGADVALQLAKLGAKITLLDVNPTALEAIAKQTDALALTCDVSDENAVIQALQRSNAVNGPARICINCAGIVTANRIVGREGPAPLDVFAKTIQVNLIGTFNVMRLAAAEMAKLEPLDENQERGVIINTASIAAFEGQIGQAAYSASKGGIVAMTLPAARELAKFGIRVMTIAPGIMETPMMKGLTPEVQKNLAEQIPFPKRLGKPEEFSRLAIQIIENQLLNGSVIRLDGAIRMGS